MRNIDSQIRPFGFYYCPFLAIGRGAGDFCNTIGHKWTHAPQHMLGPTRSFRPESKIDHGTVPYHNMQFRLHIFRAMLEKFKTREGRYVASVIDNSGDSFGLRIIASKRTRWRWLCQLVPH